VAFVSPSGAVKPENLEAGIRFYESAGFRVVCGKHILSRWGYLAGRDHERVGDLNAFLRDPDVKAIICSRGGYGASRILDAVDYESAARHPKVFVGYSDITGFHLAFSNRSRLVTFHGPVGEMSVENPPPEWNTTQLLRALTQPGRIGEIRNPSGAPDVVCVSPGTATGRIVGGNLSLIASTMGTQYEIDTRGAVLLLEEIGERPYRIDRMLAQLKMAGKFDEVVGVVIGECVSCEHDPERPSLSLDELIDDYFGALGVPVIHGLACGHGKYKATIPLGVQVTLDADACCLVIDEEATRPGG